MPVLRVGCCDSDAVCAVRSHSKRVTLHCESACSSADILGKNFAHPGFRNWSFASCRASDWRQGRRKCTECEKNECTVYQWVSRPIVCLKQPIFVHLCLLCACLAITRLFWLLVLAWLSDSPDAAGFRKWVTRSNSGVEWASIYYSDLCSKRAIVT